jgi:hypothetical protein
MREANGAVNVTALSPCTIHWFTTYHPHTIPPGIIPTEYRAEIRLEVEGAKWNDRITGSWKNIA